MDAQFQEMKEAAALLARDLRIAAQEYTSLSQYRRAMIAENAERADRLKKWFEAQS